MSSARETFSSGFGLLMSMIGVAVGLGNVWRFPYMVGKFGGTAFVLFYLAAVFVIGIPILMANGHWDVIPAGAPWGHLKKVTSRAVSMSEVSSLLLSFLLLLITVIP
jgi:SNF family Na+-dependent transporter